MPVPSNPIRRTIFKGTNWGGNYSRFTDWTGRGYLGVLKEKATSFIDDEVNSLQDMVLTFIRQAVSDLFGDGNLEPLGFFISGSANSPTDFVISGGTYYLTGFRPINYQDTAYSQQAGVAALTVPANARTDCVYLDVWVDEVGPATDGTMVDPTLHTETSRRLAVLWRVRVAEGANVAPAPFTAADGIPHQTIALALINRPGGNVNVTPDQLVDLRHPGGPESIIRQGLVRNNPVGTVRVFSVPGTPAQILGLAFGTWVQAAPGRAIVGLDPLTAGAPALGAEFGAERYYLAPDDLPAHTHAYVHRANPFYQADGNSPAQHGETIDQGDSADSTGQNTTAANLVSRLQPSRVFNIWERVNDDTSRPAGSGAAATTGVNTYAGTQYASASSSAGSSGSTGSGTGSSGGSSGGGGRSNVGTHVNES